MLLKRIILTLITVGVLCTFASSPVAASDANYTSTPLHRHPFLVCLRAHESSYGGWPYNYGYAYATGNGYYGAYQMLPGIGAAAAGTAGFPYLAWTTANRWSVVPAKLMRLQDTIVLRYAKWIMSVRGRTPWAPDHCDHILR